jgi:dTDP-4-amino-4,6-dideoxygalactose transaminase
MAALKENGIGTAIYYPVPLHLQRAFRDLGYKEGDFPVAEKACSQAMALPCFPELTLEQQEEIASVIKKVLK